MVSIVYKLSDYKMIVYI